MVGIEATQDDKEDLLLVADSTHLSTVRRLVIFSIKYVNLFFRLTCLAGRTYSNYFMVTTF